ncbi:MAG: hypothetical protein ACR2PZ_00730 [Pseudomonadales bacterium]
MSDPVSDSDGARLLHPQHPLELRKLETDQPISVVCEQVKQRNWSRVAIGYETSVHQGKPIFLKQFVDRRGQWHLDQYEDEYKAIAKAKELFSPSANIPTPTYKNLELQVIGFDYFRMTTIDVVLRSTNDSDICSHAFDYVLAASCQFLETLKSTDEENQTGQNSPVFRGFDIRNIGIPGTTPELLWNERPYLFDFGTYRKGSHQEAAARILVSVGMLNWGRPLDRFIRGPDATYFHQSVAKLAPYLSRSRLLERLTHEYEHRRKDVQGANWLQRQLKRLGLYTIGYVYVRRLRALIRKASMPA